MDNATLIMSLLERVRQLESQVGALVQRGVIGSTEEADGRNPAYTASSHLQTSDTDLERVQDYGFASRPLAGAETVTLWLNGKRDVALVIATADRRYRLTLNEGEVALYTDEDQETGGHRLVLKRGQVVEMRGRILDAEFTERIRLAAPEIETHADERMETDVAGYGEALNYADGTWNKDIYHEGATFEPSTEHGIQPPEVE